MIRTCIKNDMQDIITVTLVFQPVSELLLPQNVKKFKNGANVMCTSLEIHFQTLVAQQKLKKFKRYSCVICSFYALCNPISNFSNK